MVHSNSNPIVDPKAVIGHPNDPNRGQLLSADDEKRVDDKGRPVVDGLLWSNARTGLYLFVGGSSGPLMADRPIYGARGLHLKNTKLSVGVTRGRPVFNTDCWGACLELPSDLARDGLKRQYVAEWIGHTAAEALGELQVELAGHAESIEKVAVWLCQSAEEAITQARL